MQVTKKVSQVKIGCLVRAVHISYFLLKNIDYDFPLVML
jgi:hypothetical protein